jgi:hypothetical protein
MVSYCLQFVESFGNPTLQIAGLDSKSRLKLAVKYLLLATQLFAMNRDLFFNPQALVTSPTDPSFSFAACPEPLESLLLATSSSSVFGSDDKSRPSKREGEGSAESKSAAVAPAAGAKGKPALSKKTSEPISANTPAASDRPTVRDAVLLLSSLTREALPFCLDSVEYALQSDLRELIRRSYEPIQKKYFLKEFPTLPGSGSGGDDELVVPESSVTTLWRPTSDPLPSSSSEDGGRGETQRGKGVSKSLFPNTVGYFLLAPVKDPSSSALLSPSAEPFLTKTLMSRVELMEIELFFRRLKQKLFVRPGAETASSSSSSLHEMKSVSLVTMQQEMTHRLRTLFFLLRGSGGGARDAALLTVQEMREEGAMKSHVISLGGAKVCELSFSEEVLDSFIAILSKDRVCVTMVCERSVLLFLWSALRV